MKSPTPFILFATLLLLAAPTTYYDDEPLTVGTMEFSTLVAANDQSIAITSEYFTLILREGRCDVRDAYRFCLHNITRDYAEFYPHEVQIVLEVENICGSDCVALGYSCEQASDCASNYCVHGICRNQPTWCGDGFCDGQEDCPQDCGAEVQEEVEEVEGFQEDAPELQAEPEQEEPLVVEEESQVQEDAPQVLSDAEFREEQRRLLAIAGEEDLRQAASRARSDINWPGVAIVTVVGIVLLIIVFRRHRHATI